MRPLSKPLGFTAALALFLLALETGVALWRHNVPLSTAPVFS